jgi:hypothetical protein
VRDQVAKLGGFEGGPCSRWEFCQKMCAPATPLRGVRPLAKSPPPKQQSDVNRQGHGVVADIRRVVAGRAGAVDDRSHQVVVQATDPGDVDRMRAKPSAPRAIAARAGLRLLRQAAKSVIESGIN